jgi:hypothetical protein
MDTLHFVAQLEETEHPMGHFNDFILPGMPNSAYHQHHQHYHHNLHDEIIEDLDDSKYVTSKGTPAKQYQEQQWEVMYQDLCEYKNQTGHTRVPNLYHANKRLGRWVNNQRQHYQKRTLKQERIDRLLDLGFEFKLQRGGRRLNGLRDKVWNEMFTALCMFKEKTGHTHVPSGYVSAYTPENRKLDVWVLTQRQNYKKDNLCQERIDKLQGIGFSFEPEQESADDVDEWNAMLEELKRFEEMNHHFKVTPEDNERLAAWVREQKMNYKNEILAKDRAKRLRNIGFVFGAKRADVPMSPSFDNLGLVADHAMQLLPALETGSQHFEMETLQHKPVELEAAEHDIIIV